ncbi:MAG: DUF2914 domain-containing protein [Nitrospirota bacterium]
MKKVLFGIMVLVMAVMVGTVLAEEAAKPASPEAAKPAAKEASENGLTIARMEIAGGVENREPVGAASSFPATQEKVWCFVEFQNVTKETTINYVWTFGENEVDKVPQTIKVFSKYRTWANKTIAGRKGDWKVDILDESGAVLKSASFKIE